MTRGVKKGWLIEAADSAEAQDAATDLRQAYPDCLAPSLKEACLIIALGGDGFMLKMLRHQLARAPQDRLPIYGMNQGSVGFLLNRYHKAGLSERLAKAESLSLNPLTLEARLANGEQVQDVAVNEISLFRMTSQAAHIAITVDGRLRMPELVCDGVLVATPAGSTAYNLSVQGPILPLGANLLALTPISPFRPRRWRGALLPSQAQIDFTILQAQKRPVSIVADSIEYPRVASARVYQAKETVTLLFDPEHNLDERIAHEQFTP